MLSCVYGTENAFKPLCQSCRRGEDEDEDQSDSHRSHRHKGGDDSDSDTEESGDEDARGQKGRDNRLWLIAVMVVVLVLGAAVALVAYFVNRSKTPPASSSAAQRSTSPALVTLPATPRPSPYSFSTGLSATNPSPSSQAALASASLASVLSTSTVESSRTTSSHTSSFAHQTQSAPTSSSSAKSATRSTAFVPVQKFRGVNLGSWFVIEPWMASSSWGKMGCSPYKTEWDCYKGLGQEKAQAAFEEHWSTWITASDFTTMASYGLNLVRIPVGYWMVDSLIGTDPFPSGGLKYLRQAVRWAKAAGMYVIIDLHAGPGAQQADQPFTGQYVDWPGFYSTENYEKAYKFFTNMTLTVHQDTDFSTVFALQAINEPVEQSSKAPGMISTYYPGVQKAVRDAEASIGVACTATNFACLGVQYMNIKWMQNSGDPSASLDKTDAHILYDDHEYIKYTSAEKTRTGYLDYTCKDNRSSVNAPTIVGEWSISPADQDSSEFSTSTSGAADFYLKWSQAMMVIIEKQTAGWCFWSWKTELNDPRWDYGLAVQKGYILKDLSTLNTAICD